MLRTAAACTAYYLLCLLQLTKYQEQPQLLDGHLEGIVQPLAVLLRRTALSSTAQDTGSVQDICRLLHVLISVRGYKTVVRFFPHEASDLERVLQVSLCDVRSRGAVRTGSCCQLDRLRLLPQQQQRQDAPVVCIICVCSATA